FVLLLPTPDNLSGPWVLYSLPCLDGPVPDQRVVAFQPYYREPAPGEPIRPPISMDRGRRSGVLRRNAIRWNRRTGCDFLPPPTGRRSSTKRGRLARGVASCTESNAFARQLRLSGLPLPGGREMPIAHDTYDVACATKMYLPS